jgi:hypothetical protein
VRWDGATGDTIQDTGIDVDDNNKTTWPDSGVGTLVTIDPPNDRMTVETLDVPSTLVTPSGTAFPGTPEDGQVFWRVDEQSWYRYNASIPAWELTYPDPYGVAAASGDIGGDPHGFVNQTDSVISFANGTRTFTIAPAVTEYEYFYQGDRVTKTAADNVQLPTDTSGIWFVYFDASAVLQAKQTLWVEPTDLFVAVVYWNSTTQVGFLAEERHTVGMPWRTHVYLHQAFGTQYLNGLTIGGYTLDTDSDAAVTIGITSGAIADEDLTHNIVDDPTPTLPFEQVLSDPAQIPVYYRDGANGDWVKDTATDFWVKNTPAGMVNYNEFTGGTWQQTEGNGGWHLAYWIVATNHPSEPIISIQGQREDSQLNDAQDNNTLENLDLGTLPSSEYRFLYRIILKTSNGYANTRKFVISDVTDFRAAAGTGDGGSFVPASHASLGDLGTSGHPAGVIAVDAAAFSEVLSTTDTDTQTAFGTLDTHRHGIKADGVVAGSFAGNPKKYAVTFSVAYADTNYSISLTPVTINDATYAPVVESKTNTGFTINMGVNNITNLTEVLWATTPYGE